MKFTANETGGNFSETAYGSTSLTTCSAFFAQYEFNLFYLQRGNKHYELTNHLGNVLTVITDKRLLSCMGDTVQSSFANIVSAMDYSPFGAPLAGRTFSSEGYRFGFNSNEKDDESYGDGNAYNFGARIYDARKGSWLSVDPLQAKYPGLSAYSFTANNPIIFVDEDGRDFRYSVKIMTSVNGTKYAQININSTIHLYGKDADGVDLSSYSKVGSGGNITINGTTYTTIVKVDINYEKHETLVQANAAMKAGDNAMRVDISLTGDQMNEFNNQPSGELPVDNSIQGLSQRGGKYSNVRTQTKNIVNHESLHLIGLIDRYLPQANGAIRIPDDGYQGTSMGGDETTDNLASGDYYDFAKTVLTQTNGNSTNPKRLAGKPDEVFNDQRKFMTSVSKNFSGKSKSLQDAVKKNKR